MSQRQTARQFGISRAMVQHWVQHAANTPLDQVDWSDQSRAPHQVPHRTDPQVEALVVGLRRHLQEQSDLGEFGAEAIRRELLTHPQRPPRLPSVRTINRILERHGCFDANKRVRRPPPPKGWYLPKVAAGQAEMDQIDVVTGLVIEGGQDVEVLNLISLHGAWIGSWPRAVITAAVTREALIAHWRAFGLPAYAQFDNDMRFFGTHKHPDAVGTVIRLCLSLGVIPVFVPPRETGFQAAIESLNNRWQQKVWERFHYESLDALQHQSDKYVVAARTRHAQRQEGAPLRRGFPTDWKLNLHTLPPGQIVFLRRTNGQGQANLLGRDFDVASHWTHRLVRGEVEIQAGVLRFYALRRREPGAQPLLREVVYQLPNKYGQD